MLQFWENWGDLIWTGTIQTLTMTGIALVISTLIGLPLGTLLVLTRPNGRLANRYFYGILSSVINVVRSIPFIILLFFILPFTRFIMGTTIGVQGVLLPLIVFTAPYIARLMESALLEVDRGVVEA
ncbi:MAG: ABC transporter permease subunit, partial [Exiguobacterium chiriqhucha]